MYIRIISARIRANDQWKWALMVRDLRTSYARLHRNRFALTKRAIFRFTRNVHILYLFTISQHYCCLVNLESACDVHKVFFLVYCLMTAMLKVRGCQARWERSSSSGGGCGWPPRANTGFATTDTGAYGKKILLFINIDYTLCVILHTSGSLNRARDNG